MVHAKDNCYGIFAQMAASLEKVAYIRVISKKREEAVIEVLRRSNCRNVKLVPVKLFNSNYKIKQLTLNVHFRFFVLTQQDDVDEKATYWLNQLVLHTSRYVRNNPDLSSQTLAKEVRRQAKAVPVNFIKMPSK